MQKIVKNPLGGRGSAPNPAGGAHSAPQTPIAGEERVATLQETHPLSRPSALRTCPNEKSWTGHAFVL